jgi:hypothetical protein
MRKDWVLTRNGFSAMMVMEWPSLMLSGSHNDNHNCVQSVHGPEPGDDFYRMVTIIVVWFCATITSV